MASADAVFASWQARRAGFAPLFLEPIMRAALRALAPALVENAVVLDLGSGEGHIASVLREHGARTVCLDVDPALLAASRARHPGGVSVASDAARLPLADASVDAVFSFSLMHYVEREAAVREAHRVLRPGGRLVVVENLASNPTILAYRAWRWLWRIRYPRRLTARRYLTWGERSLYARTFPDAVYEPFELASPSLLVWPRVFSADAAEPPDSPARRVLAAFQRADRAALRACPPLAHAAWTLVLTATR